MIENSNLKNQCPISGTRTGTAMAATRAIGVGGDADLSTTAALGRSGRRLHERVYSLQPHCAATGARSGGSEHETEGGEEDGTTRKLKHGTAEREIRHGLYRREGVVGRRLTLGAGE
ncbi:hypothetical protein BRADI_1g13300v3 [Brachypodium distachyon]|uniref:Uncharacterized protein n=1 Tax=Brachypodium distachyon TaxID=15368 RepID=I1GPV4_BRADI|nr:hypothetical protein BRADI_1g13300v3 [Brachypodium distachyon]